jgi:hypothetical protein
VLKTYAELEFVGLGSGRQRHDRQRNTQTDLQDEVHPNHPRDVAGNARL